MWFGIKVDHEARVFVVRIAVHDSIVCPDELFFGNLSAEFGHEQV